jgi:AraC-like DNA-binding protein
MRAGTDILISTPYACSHETVATSRYRWDCSNRGNEPFVILQYTLAGEGRFELAGRAHAVPAGHAFIALVPEGARYFYPAEARGPWSFLWLNYYGAWSVELWRGLREEFGPVIALPPGSTATRRLREAARRIEEGTSGDVYDAAERGYALFLQCWRELESRRNDTYRDLQAALRYCESQFRNPLAVKELADRFGLTREHFSRAFRAAHGVSPAAFLRSCRLAAAAGLLRATALPLREVALRSGFASDRHLINAFRREYGTTPQAYREAG